jgi:plastocyanin
MRHTAALLTAIVLLGPAAASGDERPADAAPQRLTVHLTEYRFEPSRIAFTAGQAVELTLINDGTVLHEFVTEALKDLDVDLDVGGVLTEALGIAEIEIPPRATVVLRFTPERPGEFRVLCAATRPKNHQKEGMTAALVFRSPS